jgi:hypothetical protein
MADPGMVIVAEYLTRLANLPTEEAYYRGHADVDWPVIPSAFRNGAWGIKNEDQLAKWRRASSRFANPRPQSPLEWLVLAQHYGVKTILLDWTTNPLIALFFACERAVSRNAGIVLRFSRKTFQILKTPERTKPFLQNRGKPALIDTSSMNARTLAQDSAMSIHCDGCETLKISSQNRLFEIEHDDKWKVRTSLRYFGLTADRLYSDINVAAREFSSELEIDGMLG